MGLLGAPRGPHALRAEESQDTEGLGRGAHRVTYLLMTSSLTPTVEEKNPTDQNSFRQYIFLIQGKRWRISRLVLALILPTMADTAYFGGITITK